MILRSPFFFEKKRTFTGVRPPTLLRIFQIGPLEAWENVIQRGTTCLWEHLKYGV